MVLGATDRTSLVVTDKYYSPLSYGRTLYHLLGIDPHTTITDRFNRPAALVPYGEVVREMLA